MTKVPETVKDPFVPIVTGPAITAFSSEVISTAELMVAGFLSIPETLEFTCPVTPLASPFAEIVRPSLNEPVPCLFMRSPRFLQ